MTFAEDYKDFMAWKAQLSDSPETWEAHKEQLRKAALYDPVANDLIGYVMELNSEGIRAENWGSLIISYLNENWNFFDDTPAF